MNILVTGGAGYIGSVAVRELVCLGHKVVVIDNLSKGIKNLVDEKAIFYEGDLTNNLLLEKVFINHNFDVVMHFAAYKAAGESMVKPELYSLNIVGTINLLNCMVKYDVKKIIFSSTAAVYGEPVKIPITEDHPLKPINYYGFTKLKIEEVIDWYSELKGIIGIKFRYFNVAGDGGLHYIDPQANNIFPIILEFLNGKRKELIVFGNDYDTKDGTCVRDYIHILDLVKAHLLALNLEKSEVFNLGSSTGVSVLDLINIFEELIGSKIEFKYGLRREGDPAILVTDFKKAHKMLGWMPELSVREMVKSTLESKEYVKR